MINAISLSNDSIVVLITCLMFLLILFVLVAIGWVHAYLIAKQRDTLIQSLQHNANLSQASMEAVKLDILAMKTQFQIFEENLTIISNNISQIQTFAETTKQQYTELLLASSKKQ